jgi:L-ascorbate metabolism protein UlaG (beta-lactamase superfamily)
MLKPSSMPATTTLLPADPHTDLARRKAAVIVDYPALWQHMLADWSRPQQNDRAWLLYSANYLLCTGGVRWALDPLTLRGRLPAAARVDAAPLAALDYIVLTHRHSDHLDLALLGELRAFPARWIVPGDMLDLLRGLELPPEKVIVPQSMQTLHLGALSLTPFDGLHWESAPERPGGVRGVPATGYLAEFSGKRWLFAGDVRTYESQKMPAFGALDGLFAHLWLGRGAALLPHPPLLDSFCRFYLDLQARQVVITHLNEYSRLPTALWQAHHYRLAADYFQRLAPQVQVRSAYMGQVVEL